MQAALPHCGWTLASFWPRIGQIDRTAPEKVGMTTDFPNLHFRYPWRPYQQRVLDSAAVHILDRRIHIVAAPGAGKTTLGLEFFRLLGRPALVLSPTRTIRDQWILRLHDFLPGDTDAEPDWVSTDLAQPAVFTSITYQALHSSYRRLIGENGAGVDDPEALEKEFELLAKSLSKADIGHLVDSLRAAGILTLILDEAHHLRSEWWKALTAVLEELPEVTLVSLTATPPYDVTGNEWARYEALCGPIDEEVSVPELVKAGTLCPHQDFVWAVVPAEKDRQAIREYDRAVRRITGELLTDPELRIVIAEHPFLADPAIPAAAVLDKPELAAALLAYCRATGERLPARLLKLLALGVADVPAMDRRWWQALLEAFLFDKDWPHSERSEACRSALEKRLRGESLLVRRELSIRESRKINTQLSLNPAKIAAVTEIHALERKVRGDRLRMVVLTDFIRDDYFEKGAPPRLPELGAWPVFAALAQAAPAIETPYLGLLTGRLSLLHVSALPALSEAMGTTPFSATPLEGLEHFQRVSSPSSQKLVMAYTRLLVSGGLRVLVGTRALLGEGWDAPAINALVLASFVGSFMLTNQMRGRAIRVNKADPDKASSIWHLVTISADGDAGLADFRDLNRRFGTFAGLHVEQPLIESGCDRLNLNLTPPPVVDMAPPIGDPIGPIVAANNREMARRIQQIDGLKARWQEAIDSGDEGRLLPGLLAGELPKFRSFYFAKTLAALLAQLGAGLLMTLGQILNVLGQAPRGLGSVALMVLFVVGLFSFVALIPVTIRLLLILLKHLPVDGSVRHIGYAVRDALHDADLLQTDRHRLKVLAESKDGQFVIMLSGGSYFEQSMFADCMAEVLGPIANPRYLITREARFLGIGRTDYHAVPTPLGSNKLYAEHFLRRWRQRVSPGELLYTRGEEGRAALLQARARAFSNATARRTERRDRWQ